MLALQAPRRGEQHGGPRGRHGHRIPARPRHPERPPGRALDGRQEVRGEPGHPGHILRQAHLPEDLCVFQCCQTELGRRREAGEHQDLRLLPAGAHCLDGMFNFLLVCNFTKKILNS